MFYLGDCWNNNILYRFNEHVRLTSIFLTCNLFLYFFSIPIINEILKFLKGVAEDLRFLDWQVIRYTSPAIDLLYNIFTSTDKAFREKEYDNLLKVYHETLSNTVKLLGSNPDELFSLDDLKDELRICGNYAFIMAPILLSVSLADSSEISNLNEMCDNTGEGEKIDLISGLNEKAQLVYEQRLSDVLDDLIELGYYHKI